MFYPDLFGLSGGNVVRLYSPPDAESDDLYGDQQLLEVDSNSSNRPVNKD